MNGRCSLVPPRETPLRLDLDLGFHFYCADLCLQARQLRLPAVAVEALCFHYQRVIGSAWNLFGTPTVFVLDHKGVIRYRQIGIPYKNAIDKVLNKLIKEAEGNDRTEK
jgi:hypothetical protein